MLDYLPSPEDVLAIRCEGRLEQDELLGFMERLSASLEGREKTHLYAEVVNFSGFDPAAFGDIARHGIDYLTKLGKLGRVAIVADQDWIRWAAKAESALLPFVSYETFRSDDRQRAFSWVAGSQERPHAWAVRLIDTDRPNVLAFEIDGHVGREEMEAVSDHFLAAARNSGKVRIVGRLRHLGGFAPGGLLHPAFFAMKRELMDRTELYALIGGPEWLGAMVRGLDTLFRVDIRHFQEEEEDRAWDWVGARPTGESHPLR